MKVREPKRECWRKRLFLVITYGCEKTLWPRRFIEKILHTDLVVRYPDREHGGRKARMNGCSWELQPDVQAAETLGLAWALNTPRDTPRPHLLHLILPNSFTNCEPSIQRDEPITAILIQTTTVCNHLVKPKALQDVAISSLGSKPPLASPLHDSSLCYCSFSCTLASLMDGLSAFP